MKSLDLHIHTYDTYIIFLFSNTFMSNLLINLKVICNLNIPQICPKVIRESLQSLVGYTNKCTCNLFTLSVLVLIYVFIYNYIYVRMYYICQYDNISSIIITANTMIVNNTVVIHINPHI